MKNPVAMVARTGTRTTGLGRYVYSLYDVFEAVGYPVTLTAPLYPRLPAWLYSVLARRGVDLRTFFLNYPVRVDLDGASICHLTSQNLAMLLRLRRMPPTIVTVLDLYHLLQRTSYEDAWNAEQWADRLAVAGLMRAKAIITPSQYTKRTIVDLLHYPEEHITVVHCATDTSIFKPLPVPAGFRERYGLPDGVLLVLYVGSEDKRKNLLTLVKAFKVVSDSVPNAVLVKAGAVHFQDEAARIRQTVRELGIGANVLFVDDLPDKDLPYLYNAADIFVMPSLFEGFGLPALEAMACGRPVIAANVTSLPEVVGDAAVLFDPKSVGDLAAAIIRLLGDADHRRELGRLALARARAFSPDRQAAETWEVYRRVFEQSYAKTMPVSFERSSV